MNHSGKKRCVKFAAVFLSILLLLSMLPTGDLLVKQTYAEEIGSTEEAPIVPETAEGKVITLDLNGGEVSEKDGLWIAQEDGRTWTCTVSEDSQETMLSLPVPNREGYLFGGWEKPEENETLVYGNGIEECTLDLSGTAENGITLVAVWQKYSVDFTKAVYELPEGSEENTLCFTWNPEKDDFPDLQGEILPVLNEQVKTLLLDYTISYLDENGEEKTVARTATPIAVEWIWEEDGWGNETNPVSTADFREVSENLKTSGESLSQVTLDDRYLKQQIAAYESSLTEEEGLLDPQMSGEAVAFSDWGDWNPDTRRYEGEKDAALTSIRIRLAAEEAAGDPAEPEKEKEPQEELAEGSRVITLDMNGGGRISNQGWTTVDDGATYTHTADGSVTTLNLPIPQRTNYTFGGWKKPDNTVIVYGNGINSCSLSLSEVGEEGMTLTAVWQKYSIDITRAVYQLPFNDGDNTLDFTHYAKGGKIPDVEKDIIPFLNTYANTLVLNYTITYRDSTNTERRVTRQGAPITIRWTWEENGWADGTNPTANGDFRAIIRELQFFNNNMQPWVRLSDRHLKEQIAAYEKELSNAIDAEMTGEDIAFSNWGTWEPSTQFYINGDANLTHLEMVLGSEHNTETGISGNENYMIDTVSPENITLNLFDYWILAPFYHDQHGVDPKNVMYSSGINNQRALIFRNAGVDGVWNNWTGAGEAAREDIVKNLLNESGFPDLNIANPPYNASGVWQSNNSTYRTDEDLSYLFDYGEVENSNYGVAYSDVKGLFKINDEGNYYYSSHDNFAEFDSQTNAFYVYNTWGVKKGGKSPNGQFYPFNTADQVLKKKSDGSLTQKDVNSLNELIDHYLGLTMEADFQQPVGGMVSVGVDAKPMKFTFSGDDDVWIFIDDVLVADLGGIHDELAVEIDFSTGEILSYLAANKDSQRKVTTIKKMFEEAGKGSATNFNGNTFASNTTHTLKMFYLERGNTDSNLTLSFNLMEPAQNEIVKLDQNGKPVANVSFELYKAALGESGKPVLDKTGNHYETVENSIIGDIKTDQNGQLILPGDYDFSQHSYYVLRESEMPDGYFQPGDILLRYDKYQKHADGSSSGTNLLLVDNRWTTGATGNFTANVYQSGTLNYDNTAYGEIKRETGQAGLIVAIPVMKDTTGSWLPLYGSNMTGFNSVKYWTDGATTADNQRKALLEAALYQIYATEYVDSDGIDYKFREWYLEWDPDNSRYQGTLTDLPGEANRYYWASHADDADLSMAYYFLDLNQLNDIFGSLGDKTTKEKFAAIADRINTSAGGSTEEEALINAVKNLVRDIENKRSEEGIPPFALLDVSKFNRVFSSRIYVANVQPRLMVQKLDQDDNPLAGAEFTLYSDEDCTKAVAKGMTDNQGLLRFSLDGTNEAGSTYMRFEGDTKYWLKETETPEGYNGNTLVVPVYVTENGRTYADALKANDGVTVKKGLGKLLQTMVRYAGGGDVNATLRDIEARLFTVENWDQINDAIVVGREDPSTEDSLYLHYGLTNALMEYGTHEINGVSANPYFEVDEDIAGINVEQNYAAHEGESLYSTVALKTNLKDTNIRTLFTGSTTIVVRNRKTDSQGSFSIKKTVSGSDGATNQDFKFGVKIEKGQATEQVVLNGEYSYTVSQTGEEEPLERGTITFIGDEIKGWTIDKVEVTGSGSGASDYVKKDSEEWLVYLKHNQVFKVEGIPFHLLVTATEKDNSGYQTTVAVNGGRWQKGTSQSGIVEKPIGNPSFVFNNHKDKVTNLTVKKIVTEGGETAKGFPFTIKLYDSTWAAPLQGTYNWKIVDDQGNDALEGNNDQTTSGEITNGVLTVYLRDGDKVIIESIPTESKYLITETTMGYSPSVTVNGEKQQVVEGSISGIITERFSDDNKPLPTEIEYTNTRSGSITITKRTGTGTLLSGAGFTLYSVDENEEKTIVVNETKTSLAMRHDLNGDEAGLDKDSMRYNSGTASYIVHKTKEGDRFFYYRFLTEEERKQYYAGTLKDKEKVEAVVQFKELDLSKTYAIEETTVPKGYVQNAAIAESMGHIKLGEGSESATAVYDILYTVTNHEEMILPTTGLVGIARFLGIGIVLIAAAVVLWQMEKRRKKQE